MDYLKELTYEELKEINGGEPTAATGFWYDVTYYAVRILGALGEGASKVYG